ncbi:MAG: hypothetical protein ABFD94_12980, partial [Armatimonadia bacterium]
MTEKGMKPLRLSRGTTKGIALVRTSVRPDGVTASIVPLRLLQTQDWRGRWSTSEPHVLTLMDPPTGRVNTRKVAMGPGMEWCFSNRDGEIITEWPFGQIWQKVNGRQVKRKRTGLFRQDLDSGKRTFIVEGRHPLMAADGRLAYVPEEGRAISIRQPDGTTTSYPSPQRWTRPLQWIDGDRFILWQYDNYHTSILDRWLR